jgi:hypothetical protein
MKLEQYRLGERFIDQIAQTRGHDTVKRIWEGPANLPTMLEIREPGLWVARVLDAAGTPQPTGPAVLADVAPAVSGLPAEDYR